MSDKIDGPLTASAWIADRIAARYAHPSRRAYLYLLQLESGADTMPIPPDSSFVLRSWYDEGDGLAAHPAVDTVARCGQLYTTLRADGQPVRGQVSTRQLMARIVVFTLDLIDAERDPSMRVELFSRALAFTPKADRRVIELWKPGGEGWYSTYTGDRDLL